MTENVEKLLLEHMKRFQASLDRIERRLDEVATRVSGLEASVVLIIQHLTNFSAENAAKQVAIDNINRRLDRIERRLEMTN